MWKLTLLAIIAVLQLSVDAQAAIRVPLSIDALNLYQEFMGAGAALTESSAKLLMTSDRATSDAAISAIFGTSCMRALRIPMGSCDFSIQKYTYNDFRGNYNMSHFSTSQDEVWIIPALKRIQAYLRANPTQCQNSPLTVIASPWSPPAWLKNTSVLEGGSLLDSDAVYNAYGEYFARFVLKYRASYGLSINYVTLQNEALFSTTGYPSMYLSPAQEAKLVVAVDRAFQRHAITYTRILLYDHNWDHPEYPIQVLTNLTSINGRVPSSVAGSAFHCYGGEVSAQSVVKEEYPGLAIHFTECSGGQWAPNYGDNILWDVQNLVIGAANHWTSTVLKWNLALDPTGGPKIDWGCSDCRGIVTISNQSLMPQLNEDFYSISHLSRFVAHGSRRVGISLPQVGVPFISKYRQLSLVLINANTTNATFETRMARQELCADVPVPPRSVATAIWNVDAHGNAVMNATVQIWVTSADGLLRLALQSPARFHACAPL